MEQQAATFLPRAILRERDRPRLLFFAPALLLLWALLDMAQLLVMSLAASDGAVHVVGSAMAPTEYRWRVVPVLLLSTAQVILLAVAIQREKVWARPLAVWLPLSNFVLPALLLPSHVPRLEILGEVGTSMVVAFGFAVWYFYFRPPVRAYYERLAARR